MTISSIVATILRNPWKSMLKLLSLIRGTYYIVVFRITRNNIRIAFPFYTNAPVRIIGPGTVVIGKSCRVLRNMFKGLTIITHNSDSIVTIGDNCALGGLTVRCTGSITFGNRLMTAYSLVQDSFLDNIDITRYKHDGFSGNKDISIGNNIWIGAQCIILGGCKIGDDSVLSFGTWCCNMVVDEFRLISGNPARRALPIDRLLQLTGG